MSSNVSMYITIRKITDKDQRQKNVIKRNNNKKKACKDKNKGKILYKRKKNKIQISQSNGMSIKINLTQILVNFKKWLLKNYIYK